MLFLFFSFVMLCQSCLRPCLQQDTCMFTLLQVRWLTLNNLIYLPWKRCLVAFVVCFGSLSICTVRIWFWADIALNTWMHFPQMMWLLYCLLYRRTGQAFSLVFGLESSWCTALHLVVNSLFLLSWSLLWTLIIRQLFSISAPILLFYTCGRHLQPK